MSDQGGWRNKWRVSQRLKQEDGLAPTLFNLALNNKTCINVLSTAINRSNQIVGYADDLNIVERTILSVKEPFTELENVAKEIGPVINEQKTKLLFQSRQQRN